MTKKSQYKINKVQTDSVKKKGKIFYNGVKPQAHEVATLEVLAACGFDVELIVPTSTPKAKNPDILMMGTIWEIKAPMTTNAKTLKKRFHKASKQANRVIFDLRGVKHDYDKTKSIVIKMFEGNPEIRRMIIVPKSGNSILDFSK